MAEYLDLETWNRRAHFEFFRDYDIPFFNICANVDVTSLLNFTRANKAVSFFIAYHFLSLKAVNEIEQFRYRLQADKVRVYDRIHGGTIVLLSDESFSFAYFDYEDDFKVFHARASESIQRARTTEPNLHERDDRDDLIHHSVVPWVHFTGVSHARKLGQLDSVPKISFGKCSEAGGRVIMPVSVEVHHALMDGLHVGRYFEKFQTYLDDAESLLRM